MIPNSNDHQVSPDYVRELVQRIGKPQRWIADRVGISERRLRYLIAGSREVDGKMVDVKLSYPEQFALECLSLGDDQGVTEAKVYRRPTGGFTFRRYELKISEFEGGAASEGVPNRFVGAFPVPHGTMFSMDNGEVVMVTANKAILTAEDLVRAIDDPLASN
ncbi:hypothetical protein [Burkholderia pseudomallei]|uniref:hypothetical protein n=1 Tax=Burkholderia pseudomallei TaxID=28450 RepID=UPI001269F597|nr:hypothetical protein [Burkholderia pseudomallei]